MTFLRKLKSLCNSFCKDELGTMATVWAMSLFAIILAIGTAFDYAAHQTAKQNSQHAADLLALAAAAYIRDNGDEPKSNSEGFVDGTEYTLSSLGLNPRPYGHVAKDENGNITEEATFNIKYDTPENGMLTATVNGASATTFMKITGHQKMSYFTTTVVTYEGQGLKDPASVFLVLDNSGSMDWNDNSGNKRLTSLKNSVTGFMTQLNTLNNGRNDTSKELIRTAMYVYNSDYISSQSVQPAWGTIEASKISNMIADGGTNSYAAMKEAESDMGGEVAIHTAEHGNDAPLRYVIFMTDGVNNDGQTDICTFVEGTGTPYYEDGHYHWERTKQGETYIRETKPDGDKWTKVWSNGHNYDAIHSKQGDPKLANYDHEDRNVCLNYDEATLQSCQTMKDMGVEIYTIGYALPTNNEGAAVDLLKGCASDEDETFFRADSASGLQTIFSEIGEDIKESVIRLAQ